MTCTTCFTLNPPGAPACVRCNTPLGAGTGPTAVPGMVTTAPAPAQDVDRTEGSKRIGPGLAGAARGAPGSSRAQAAAVQPPGYGLDSPATDPAPPPAPAPVPAAPGADPRVHRRVAVAGGLLVAAVLVAGGILLWLTRPAYLDTTAVGRSIGDQLTRRLGGPVAVTCPADQRRRAGVTFACTATDDAGGRRAVTVTVVDNSGKFTWTLGTA
jgi:Domain of unknown function (DUF4333)